VLASLAIVTLIGSLLALVTNLSVALVFRLPWRGPIPLGGQRSELARLETPKMEFPFLALGFGGLLVAQIFLLLATITLGALAGPIQGAIIVVAALWLTGIFVSIIRATSVDPSRQELGPGDPDYDFAVALAKKSGIELRAVQLRSKPPDRGYQAAHGAIVLTHTERSDLNEVERQIILTQWIGELKYSSDTRRQRLILGGTMALMSLTMGWISIARNLHIEALLAVAPTMIPNAWNSWFYSKKASRQSKAIDKFTLQEVGDYLQVQQAISKDFLLTLSPSQRNQMTPREEDEAIHRRLNKLREAATELNIDPATLKLP